MRVKFFLTNRPIRSNNEKHAVHRVRDIEARTFPGYHRRGGNAAIRGLDSRYLK